MKQLAVVKNDISDLTADVIVCASNEDLSPIIGFGDSMHRNAGAAMAVACQKIGRCAVSGAVATPVFNLLSKFVIHAVVPKFVEGQRAPYCSSVQYFARA